MSAETTAPETDGRAADAWAYALWLQRLIEHYAAGRLIPEAIAARTPHHKALLLNSRMSRIYVTQAEHDACRLLVARIAEMEYPPSDVEYAAGELDTMVKRMEVAP